MKKVRLEVDLLLEIDIDTDDKEEAEEFAKDYAYNNLLSYKNHRGKHFFEDDDVYMSNYGMKVLSVDDAGYDKE